MRSNHNPYLGIGLYSIPEAARILRTPSRTLYSWVQGYTFWHKDEKRIVGPLLQRATPELAEYRILTFVDLVELHIVRLLRKSGVQMKVVRESATRLSEKYQTTHPFAMSQLATDGARVFDEEFEQLGTYQFVFEVAAQPFLKNIDYKNKSAEMFWPIGRDKVVLNPHRSFGAPIVHHGSVPTHPLYKMRAAGESPERIAKWWGIPIQSVEYATEYEMGLA